ncbi:MAG: S8 family serine peptidase [Cytophaga sp.]|uniref:S8 family serine peptidase n=1 Tax=Cytophaga sp. TaxID=29535 RepID=UPI003F8054F3
MGSHNRFIFLLVLLSSSSVLWAQNNPYVLYLKDKHGTLAINNPSAFLSPRSISKRIQNTIPIDSSDLPVSQVYIDQIAATGCEIIYTSKWLNAVIVKASVTAYNDATALPCVASSRNSFRTSFNRNTQAIQATTQQDRAADFSDKLGITQMHQMGYTGNGILIAVTDAGFPGVDTLSAFRHLWENNQVLYAFDVADNNTNIFDDYYHGTAVLSVLAAKAPNYTGVVPEAEYILLRTEVEATETKLEEYNWLRAAEIADSCGADIIAVSLGYTTFDNSTEDYSYADMNGHTSIIAYAANTAYDKGMFVVCGAGNEGSNAWRYVSTPADAENVITVGSVDWNNTKAYFSSVGPTADGRMKPNLSAPGVNITCITSDGSFLVTGGTSLSSPMISGILAGMMQAFPALSRTELTDMLYQSCDTYENPTNLKGHGVPDFTKADIFAHIFMQGSDFILAPTPYQAGVLTLKVPGSNDSYTLNVIDNQGRNIYAAAYESDEKLIHLENDFQHIAPGFYFIIVESVYGREILKWIIL